MSSAKNNQIELLLEQLRQEFIHELPNRLVELEQLILSLKDEDHYAEIYRIVHSLKGSGGTHGLKILSFTCHQLEEVLETSFKQHSIHSTETIEQLLRYVDLIDQIQKSALQGNFDLSKIEEQLHSLRKMAIGESIEVLVVEPSTALKNLISEILDDLPVNITHTESGITALDLLLHRRYHVVISALETPSLNGVGLIAATKASRRYRDDRICCLLISSNLPKLENSSYSPDYILQRNVTMGNRLHDIVENAVTRYQ